MGPWDPGSSRPKPGPGSVTEDLSVEWTAQRHREQREAPKEKQPGGRASQKDEELPGQPCHCLGPAAGAGPHAHGPWATAVGHNLCAGRAAPQGGFGVVLCDMKISTQFTEAARRSPEAPSLPQAVRFRE